MASVKSLVQTRLRTSTGFHGKLLAASILALFLVASFARVAFTSDSSKVFSKRLDLPLLKSPSSSAGSSAKAKWNEELTILERKGRWLKVSADDGEGWVYVGNISVERLPEENKNDMPVKASGLNATAAGRGLSDGASAYADRHNLEETAALLRWAEQLNSKTNKDEARDYLKAHKLGEYRESK